MAGRGAGASGVYTRMGICPSGPGIVRFSMERSGSTVPATGIKLSAASLRASEGDSVPSGGLPWAAIASSNRRTFGSNLSDNIILEVDYFRRGCVIARVRGPVLRIPSVGGLIPRTAIRVGPSPARESFLQLAIKPVLRLARWLYRGEAATLHLDE